MGRVISDNISHGQASTSRFDRSGERSSARGVGIACDAGPTGRLRSSVDLGAEPSRLLARPERRTDNVVERLRRKKSDRGRRRRAADGGRDSV